MELNADGNKALENVWGNKFAEEATTAAAVGLDDFLDAQNVTMPWILIVSNCHRAVSRHLETNWEHLMKKEMPIILVEYPRSLEVRLDCLS